MGSNFADFSHSKAAAVLKEGLERTLSQTRQLVGTIERVDGGHSIVRKKSSAVKYVVQYLDSPEDKFPSFADISKAHFVSAAIDIELLSNAPMTFGEKPEAHPDNSPIISSYKANFIPGGLIFNIHTHHFSNAIAGWASFTRQLAENCYAVANRSEFPAFDPRCLDRSFFANLSTPKEPIPEELLIDAPPRADRHPQHRHSQSLIFHLPKSRAAKLKKAASHDLPRDVPWISTYDAVCAIMWRVFSRIREPLYKPDPAYHPLWASGVNMAQRFPELPERIQGNCSFDTISTMSPIPQLTVAEIISEAPLSKLASYTRQMTSSVTTDMVAAAAHRIAPIRNKEDLSVRVDSFPPMALFLTDWRGANICTADFGFGKPAAYRHLFDTVSEGQVIVYPSRSGPAGDDEGIELQATFEKELVQQLVNDAEWSQYFEFRGVDAEPAVYKAKL